MTVGLWAYLPQRSVDKNFLGMEIAKEQEEEENLE
jgi:hypothetical protein